MWTIVTKEQSAEYARVNTLSIDDAWYDIMIGAIETYTGWHYLESPTDRIDRFHGTGTPYLLCKTPINSVSSIIVSGSSLSSSEYSAEWNKIYLINDGTVSNIFKNGIKNVIVSYNVGGTNSLPSNYIESLRSTLLMCLKEFIAIPRNEGSDQTLRKYRPDRTMMPEEVLKSYGIHGKIQGIMKANLPSRIRVT